MRPYFALRSYQDGGETYAGQIGSEPTPSEFVDALVACTADWLRVLQPAGSIWVNLGDKYAGGQGDRGGDSSVLGYSYRGGKSAAQNIGAEPIKYEWGGVRPKSLMGLPWRYALRCIDELGLILRAEVIWSKVNGLPESVTDRVRRSHEQWFHFTRQGRYFAAIDEVREPSDPANAAHAERYNEAAKTYGKTNEDRGDKGAGLFIHNPLGKVPGSVWSVPSEPLVVPESLGVDHFAAFPSELPRRIILGWSPSGYCTVCDEPRRAVVDKRYVEIHQQSRNRAARMDLNDDGFRAEGGMNGREVSTIGANEVTITGYVCACLCYSCRNGGAPTCGHVMDDAPPTRPAVVLDPFAGTGTTVAVAHLLGRHGIGTDLSRDYLKLAKWRCTSDRRLRDKVLDRTGIPNPDPPAIDGQLDLFGEGVA